MSDIPEQTITPNISWQPRTCGAAELSEDGRLSLTFECRRRRGTTMLAQVLADALRERLAATPELVELRAAKADGKGVPSLPGIHIMEANVGAQNTDYRGYQGAAARIEKARDKAVAAVRAALLNSRLSSDRRPEERVLAEITDRIQDDLLALTAARLSMQLRAQMYEEEGAERVAGEILDALIG